ncbi:MAG TPA: hypothetical protein VHO91_22980, partial [Rhodopila sp.]|nr:hypothetical protein [Rhodopila sp.]
SGTSYSAATNPLAATITGFRPGDAIAFLDPVTTAIYAAGSSGAPGQLTLAYGGSTVEVLGLAGSFAGDTFTLSQTSSGGSVVSLAGPTIATSTQAGTTDSYSWTGVNGAAWGSAANWHDATAGTSSTTYAPGRLTAVTLGTVMGPTPTVISGGGIAGSVNIGGWFSLAGFYAVGGTLTIGLPGFGAAPVTTANPTPGALTLLGAGTISTAGMMVLDGTLSIDPGATITVSGAASVGIAPGTDVPNNGSYVSTGGAAGTLELASGGTLSAAGGLAVNDGSLANAGGVVTVGSSLTIGTVANGSPGASFSTAPASGVVAISAGGSLAVTGGLIDLNGIAVADGIGSTLSVSGAITVQGSGTYSDASPFGASTYTAGLAAVNGGHVQAGGLILNTAATGVSVLLDSISAVEIGFIGGAATGAITIDPGRALTMNGSAGLSLPVIDNGTLVIASGRPVEAGSISGSGIVQIDPAATWSPQGGIAATNTILFAGAGGTLSIGALSGSPTTPVPGGATLLDFQTGDSLVVPTAVTAATYTPAAAGSTTPGTLTLKNGSTTVATFSLAGVYTNRTFLV